MKWGKLSNDMAFKDGLTNLYNHRYFQDFVDRELNRAIRYKKPLSLLMLDLDHFKKINDKHGRPVGDIVLGKVRETIKNTIRDRENRYIMFDTSAISWNI